MEKKFLSIKINTVTRIRKKQMATNFHKHSSEQFGFLQLMFAAEVNLFDDTFL